MIAGKESAVGVFGPVFGTLAAVLAAICLVLAWKYLQAKETWVNNATVGLNQVILNIKRKFAAQRNLRDLTPEEIREFIEGDSSAASLAPDGMDRAMMLPYKVILPPDGIAVGKFPQTLGFVYISTKFSGFR